MAIRFSAKPSKKNRSPRIMYGTTIGKSARYLLRGQLEWFQQQEWQVMLVSSPDSDAEEATLREKVAFFGIRMERDISVFRDLYALIQWVKLLRMTRPDVINLGTPKASLLGGIASWMTRIPRRIYVVRGLRLEGITGIKKNILWAVEKLTISLATDVVVVSKSLGQELVRRRLVSAKKAWLIGKGSSNGVDAAAIARRVAVSDRDALRQNLGISSESFVIGYIGRASPDKGVGTLIEAFQAMDQKAALLLIGGVEDDLIDEVAALGSRAHVLPWSDDVWGQLAAIDVLCLPTLREGFPNVVLEAGAASIPTITTKATGAIDSVIDGETGYLIDVGDHVALMNRLNQLMDSPGLVKKLGQAAQTLAKEDYCQEMIWNGLESIARGYGEEGTVVQLEKALGSGSHK